MTDFYRWACPYGLLKGCDLLFDSRRVNCSNLIKIKDFCVYAKRLKQDDHENEARMVSVGHLPNACFEARFFVSTIIERLGFAVGIFYSIL